MEADPGSSLTFEVILFEGSNEIQFQYLSMTDSLGQGATGAASGKSGLEGRTFLFTQEDDGSSLFCADNDSGK